MSSDQEHLDHLRHSAAHLLAATVLQLYPDAKPTIGPAIEDGFYYDFAFGEITLSERSESKGDSRKTAISEKDLPKIEKWMKKLLPTWKEFTHEEVTPEAARERFKDNPYKLELIDEIAAKGEPITLYTAGEFTDLCRGGHVEAPNKELKHIKLTKLAGAYWRGDENQPQLTRIYGTAFPTKEALDEHLHLLEEAKKRDHRKLGQDLDLFTFSPLVGSGLPLFTPRGTTIRHELEKFLRELQTTYGYQSVHIPHIARGELYRTSGHWDKFQENLFHVKGSSDEEFVIKPMNCPHHTQIYAARPRSYRELPLRFAETTTIYRDEKPGELLGLARVRSITQDDAHLFCTPDQLAQEISTTVKLIQEFYAVFGFELEPHLSVRDPKQADKYLGDDAIWERAESELAAALDTTSLTYARDEGEAAFYGPKIDFVARDSLKRRWQLATVQLDFNMPRRFELTYTDEAGTKQTPVMIHRAVSGSIERFMAILLEHYAGALPLWLSPTQAAILPISDDQIDYATQIKDELTAAGIRCDLDDRSESIGKKIRDAEMQKAPYMLIVGKKEAADKTVAVRSRQNGDEGTKPLTDIQERLLSEITQRQ